jgi:polyisoprenoid-binding protein YceI
MYTHTFATNKLPMNKLISTILMGLSAVLISGAPISEPKTLTIKPEASKVEWFAEKVTGKHNGIVSLKSGSIEIEENNIIGGSFSIDMTSINTTDLKGEYKDKLDGHLKSKDFLNVKEFNTATFKINTVKPLKSDEGFNHTIAGELTIKGITHPIAFPANIKITDGKLAAYGEMTIDRTKYDIKYGSASFFESIGDKAIMDDFIMKISLGAKI